METVTIIVCCSKYIKTSNTIVQLMQNVNYRYSFKLPVATLKMKNIWMKLILRIYFI